MWEMSVSFLHAVLFDLDGLLADTEPLHYASWRDVIQEVFGVTVSWTSIASIGFAGG
jgi:beta-phosphoglucomutase-like phosphatase (HAD superfamily)